ncbi:MAG: holo-ACP synthase [Dialister sp.]|nr:holo-ACP synthase [Dialister sp.]
MFVGVDLVRVSRWEELLEKHPKRMERIFTPEEIEHCEAKGKTKAESYAALWAVREAAGKAMGIGIFGSSWKDAWVSWSRWSAPELHLQGTFKKRAEQLGITGTSVSISHDGGVACAVVVMEGGAYDFNND